MTKAELRTEIDRAESPWAALRVLDITWMAAGPIITSFFAHLGADVVKVESRQRLDLMRIANRSYGWAADDDIEASPIFNELAAGKRSIALNLKEQSGRDLLRRLALTADIVVENMRPGKVESMGLEYASLARENPALIMCSLSAHGRGPDQDMPGYAPIFWAEGGGAWMSGWPNGDPTYVRGPVDLHAGAFAALSVVAALLERDRTGRGCYIDCSGIEAVAAACGIEIVAAANGIHGRSRAGNDAPPYVPNDVFPVRGEYRWVAISVRDDGEWDRLARLLDVPDSDVRRFPARREARAEDAGALYDLIAARTQEWAGEELVDRLLAAGIPAAMSRTLEDALAADSLHDRGSWITVDHERIGLQTIAGLPWFISERNESRRGTVARRILRGAPFLGADTDDVLTEWLGVSADDIAARHADGTLT